MYYVAKNYPPYWKDRLTQSADLAAMKAWAQRESAKSGEHLTVREGDFPGFHYGKTRATYVNGKEV